MRTQSVLVTVALALLVGACLPAPTSPNRAAGGAGELVINSFGGTWGQAIQLGLIDSFERETGVKVTLRGDQDVLKSAAAVRAGQLPPEDIIDTSAPRALQLEREGLLAPIDYASFARTDLDKLPAYARKPYALGWGQFAIGLCYDREIFPDPASAPKTWADFWDVGRFPGKRSMLAWTDEPQPEFGLIAAGVAIRDVYPLDLESAFEKLTELRPHVPRFPSDPAELGQMLVDREVVMEACFAHRVQRLVDGGITRIAISFDQARLQTQYASVWKNAPNKENAMKFLAHIVKAEPQAAWAQIGSTGPINPDAFQLIPADLAAKLPTSPAYAGTWAKNDDWYAALADGSKSNREVIPERWRAWVASACGPGAPEPALPAFRGALVGSAGCGPGR